MSYALGISALQDVVGNAKQQRPGCSLSDLMKAFLFYHRNDAFITI